MNRLKRIADGLGVALVGDCRTLVVVGALVVAVGLAGCGAPEPGLVGQQPKEDRAASARSLPAVSDLPSVYRPVGEFAGRGEFYAAGGQLSHRLDDGNHYHGYDGPLVWATDGKSSRRQGVLYGVEDGAIVSAGYLIRQADLVSGKSFHGMSLRELDLPAARSMTVDLIPGEASDGGQYLWLWHFRAPPDAAEPMLPAGTLPAATTLPSGYTVFACDHIPETRFCPGMGRHFTDLSAPSTGPAFSRQPTTSGDDGVIYGEAAGKLIFIEYVFGQDDLVTGVSWPEIPLDGLSIPPIDNVHVLHFGTDGSTTGRYTVHMYFLPEEVYLGWDAEPSTL